jgi:hypothetical protein
VVDRNVVSRLRLASARRRIDAFLEQIGSLRDSSFPHDDGKRALKLIEEFAREQRANVELPDDFDSRMVDRACLQVAEFIERNTSFLGFILRSTNVRNPFELHDPLKDLIAQVLGNEALLLISAEWNFVPFTYPRNIGILPDFVLIGTPAPEAGNVLITPLAGHEIGHSIWHRFDLEKSLSGEVNRATLKALQVSEVRRKRLLLEQGIDELGINILRGRCSSHALRQLEEIVSDLFGLQVFGSAYLYAFEYLLAPSGYPQDIDYPSEKRRLEIMRQAADGLSIDIDDAVYQRWNEKPCEARDRDMFTVVSEVVNECLGPLRTILSEKMSETGIVPPSRAAVEDVLAAFRKQEPYGGKATLPEIVTAGWVYLRERHGLPEPEQAGEYRVLNDLMLKSVEVAEYRGRLGLA